MKTASGLLLATALLCPQGAELEPGLVGEYFEFAAGLGAFPAIPAGRKPTYVRVDKDVSFDDVTGDFYGTKLESNFYVRWTGILRVEKAGTYAFFSESDDGSRVTVAGKIVVDNGGVHPMTEKRGEAELKAGDHPIRIEFFQGGGEAGCKVTWQAAGAGRQKLAKSVFHAKGAEKIDFDPAAWAARPQGRKAQRRGTGRYAEMDHGPFFCGTIDALVPGKGNFANKGFAVRVGSADKPAGVCFDSELLRFSAGWTGGFIGHPSGRDGIEGQPFAEGTNRFGTRKGSLGWAKDGVWTDPRPKPFGPLPREWARYSGLYVHGVQVVFAYTVGGTEVLDRPAFDAASEAFTRTLSIGPSAVPLAMLVCEKDGAKGAVQGGAALLEEGETVTSVALGGRGATLEASGSRIELRVPARPAPVRVLLRIRNGPKAELAKAPAPGEPEDLAPLLKGGPGRNAPVTVAGALGKESGPYAVDTLTVPYENPSKSYMRLTAMDFFADGRRAAVSTMDGDVWIVSGIDDALASLAWRRFASGLFQPLGLRIVDGKVHTLGRDQITRLHDLDGDGEADFYENFNNDCGVTPNYHEFANDLQTDSKGNFYYAKGSDLGGAKVPYHGTIVRVSKDGRTSEVVATGFRAPNGISVGPNDEITASDNQGNWVPTTPVHWIVPGQFCGFLPCSHRKPEPKEPPAPLCWIPHGVDNSGGGQVWVTSDRWGLPRGELLHLSYGKCALFHVLRENAGGVMQGGVVKFPHKFQSGVMRGRFNPADGQLYVVGMRGWQTDAPREGAFQRVRHTGAPLHAPLAVKTAAKGLEITFANPLDRASAEDLDGWSARWCNIKWTGDYGSPEFGVADPAQRKREPLPIQSASLSKDGKTVVLGIAGLKPAHCVILNYQLKAADGTPIKQEIDYTIHRIP